MKRSVFAKMVLLLVVLGMFASASAWATDFSAWSHKMKIQFTGYNPPFAGQVLTNFPALVVLGTNVPGGLNYGDFYLTNADLRFADSNKTTELNYEIEAWDTNAVTTIASPTALSGLQLWLSAGAGVGTSGSSVTSWVDQASGYVATQGVAGAQPTLISNSSLLNNRPAIRFNGSTTYLDLGNISAGFPSAATLFVIAALSNSTDYCIYGTKLSGYDGDGVCHWRHASNVPLAYNGTFRNSRAYISWAANPVSGPHVFLWSSSSSINQMIVDGVPGPAQTPDYNKGDWHAIGRSPSGPGAYFSGDIAEIVIYNRVLSAGEQTQVSLYLAQKYGIHTTYGQLGQSAAWVQVPKLADSNTTIWAYWGNSGTNAPAYRTNGATWDSTFAGVWHMGSTNVLDSTTNANNGTSLGSDGPVPIQPGVVGNAGWLNPYWNGSGYNLRYNCGSSASLYLPKMTLSYWVNFDTFLGGGNISAASKWTDWYSFFNNGKVSMNGSPQSTTGAQLGQWTHVTIVESFSTSTSFFVNGQGAGGGAGVPIANTGSGFALGAETTGGADVLSGWLDEVRMENVLRTTNWVWASYMTMASNAAMTSYQASSNLKVFGTSFLMR